MNSYSLESMKGAQSMKRGRISVRLVQIAFKWKQFPFWKHWGIRWKCPNWSNLKPPFPIWHELWNFIWTYRYINNVAIDIMPKLSLSFAFEWWSKTAYFHPGICYNRNRFDYILNLKKTPSYLGGVQASESANQFAYSQHPLRESVLSCPTKVPTERKRRAADFT